MLVRSSLSPTAPSPVVKAAGSSHGVKRARKSAQERRISILWPNNTKGTVPVVITPLIVTLNYEDYGNNSELQDM